MDLSQVKVEGSNADVLTWPETASITEFWIRPNVLHVRYTKQGQWTPVDMGGALQEATVWVFVNVNGQWTATGAERLRPNQVDKPQDPHPVNTIGVSWLYAKDRWPTLAGYKPAEGEVFGFMVAAGSTRSDFNVAVKERTNVVFAKYSNDTFELLTAPSVPTPPKENVPVIPPFDLVQEFARLHLKLDAILATKTEVKFPVYSGGLFGYTLTLTPKS